MKRFFLEMLSVLALAALGFVVAIALTAALSVATTHAAGAAADPDMWSLIRPVLDAVRGGEYWIAGAAGLVALATAARRWGGRLVPWFGSSAGSAVLAFAVAFGASLSAQLAAGEEMSISAARIALDAAGIYSLGRAVLVPTLMPLAEKWGGWRGTVISLALWALSKPDRKADATAAGNAAVDETPAGGMSAVVGEPEDIK